MTVGVDCERHELPSPDPPEHTDDAAVVLGPRGLVFVSHSSRRRAVSELVADDTEQRHLHRKNFLGYLLDELTPRLEKKGFDVWMDRADMHGGDLIDQVIHDALALCAVGVILVDRDALNSEYVRREINVLMYRNAVDGIAVIPVLLGVGDQDLAESKLGTTGLPTLLPVRPTATKRSYHTASGTADEIVAEVDCRAPDVPTSPELLTQRWIEDVTHLLSEVPERVLWRAAEILDLDRTEWGRSRNKHRTVATALLASSDAGTVYLALREVIEFIDDSRAERMVDRVLPLWVDLGTAQVVLGVNQLPYDERLLGLSTRAFRLGRHLVLRATLSAPWYTTLSLPDVFGDNPLEEALKRYDRTVRDALNLSDHDMPDAVLSDLSKMYSGVYVLLRFDIFDTATATYTIEELQQRFPSIAVVLLASRSNRMWSRIQIQNAYESFDHEAELRARKYVSQTNQLISRLVPVDSDE